MSIYMISKVNEDYEGTWSNTLMYETDLQKAIEIADNLQLAIVSVKQVYVDIKRQVKAELKKSFPHYGNYNFDFDEQLKNIDSEDLEHYFEKEERLITSLIENQLTDTERFLYDISYMDSSDRLVYVSVREIKSSNEVLGKSVDKDEFWKVEYSTKEKSKEHAKLFEILPGHEDE